MGGVGAKRKGKKAGERGGGEGATLGRSLQFKMRWLERAYRGGDLNFFFYNV